MNTTSRTTVTKHKLPAGVYYSRRNGGLWVSWNGRPEGQVYYTYDRETAYGGEGDLPWASTPYQGADGACRLSHIIRLAAEYTA
jgi:hypothetical protein